jgi:hypothetical protein
MVDGHPQVDLQSFYPHTAIVHVGDLMSVSDVTLDGVEVTAELLARIPDANLRVSRAEFGAVWSFAEVLGVSGRARIANTWSVCCGRVGGLPISRCGRRWPAGRRCRLHRSVADVMQRCRNPSTRSTWWR